MRIKGKKGGVFKNGRSHQDHSSTKNKKAREKARDVETADPNSSNSIHASAPSAQESENFTEIGCAFNDSGFLSRFQLLWWTTEHAD